MCDDGDEVPTCRTTIGLCTLNSVIHNERCSLIKDVCRICDELKICDQVKIFLYVFGR